MRKKRVQTRRSITFTEAAYQTIRAIAVARGEPMGAVVERAIAELAAASAPPAKEG